MTVSDTTIPPVPERIFILDIDGLRHDVFQQALRAGMVPGLSSLFSDPDSIHLRAISPAPSVTFASQTSIFTGLSPSEHGITGNQFFDRFGRNTRSTPRFYAFDIGDTLAVDDAVLTFSGKMGLLNQSLPGSIRTLYEIASAHGWRSIVVNHMLSRGAETWLKPNLVELARFAKGGGLLGLDAEQYDDKMLAHYFSHLRSGECPQISTLYFMGLDHHSHQFGPQDQLSYLSQVVDGQIQRLLSWLRERKLLNNALVLLLSDHGQISVPNDDRHSLRLAFPFEREMGYLFDALNLDVHDYPGEDPNCDAVVAANGGMAHVYLQNRVGRWQDPPRFEEDVLSVARAFWQANRSGAYAPDLQNALAAIFIRNVALQGWHAPYLVYTPEGLLPVDDYLSAHPEIAQVAANQRLQALSAPNSGDLLLLSNYAAGTYFAAPIRGVHGGLHPEDSQAVCSFVWLNPQPEAKPYLQALVQETFRDPTCVGLEEVLPFLCQLCGWNG